MRQRVLTRESRILKNFLKKHARVIVPLALLLLAVIYTSMPTPPSVREPQAQQMEKDSRKWFAQEQSLSQLGQDLKAGKVKVVGLGFENALVTADKQYYVKIGAQRALLFEMLKDKLLTAPPTLLTLGDVAPPVEGAAKLTQHLSPGMISIVVLLMLTGMVGAQMGFFRLGRKRFKKAGKSSKTFQDVIGVEEAKESMQDLVACLKNPKKFTSLGGKPPRGILMVGPPGTGKTLLAQALAGEAGVNIISVGGGDFSAKYFGQGIGYVNELFDEAERHAPCVVFIDEFDGIGRRNPNAGDANESENNRVINTFLVRLDGFKPNSGVMVIGATNHLDNVDPSVIRPGRFDRVVHLSLPTVAERERMFALYIKELVTDGAVDIGRLARMSAGLSPAAIATVVNAGALLAGKEDAPTVTTEHLLQALDTHRIGLPSEATKAALNEDERLRIAVHEAGHGIISRLRGIMVEKVTIMPHGPGLGLTQMSHRDQKLYTETDVRTQILLLLGGRGAEKLMLESLSTGASDDLERATSLAYQMVTRYGFSPNVGTLSFAGFPTAAQQDSVPPVVLDEIRTLMNDCEHKCDEMLRLHRPALEALTRQLLEHETVDGCTVDDCLDLCEVGAEAEAEAIPA